MIEEEFAICQASFRCRLKLPEKAILIFRMAGEKFLMRGGFRFSGDQEIHLVFIKDVEALLEIENRDVSHGR